MKIRALSIAAAATLCVALAGQATAEERGGSPHAALASRIDTGVARLDFNLQHGKVGAAQRDDIVARRAKLQALAQRLRAGQSVSPKEVDDLLGETAPWR